MAKAIEQKRKLPTQRRAEVTVDALMVAASQVLERDGLDRLNTTVVAERAGVSIGTLYQYFGNKDDILLALAQRELRRVLDGVEAVYRAAPQGHEGRYLVRAILEGFRQAPPERQATLDLMFRNLGRGELVAEGQRFTAALARELAGERNLTHAQAFVLSRAVLGVVRATLEDPDAVTAQVLEDELVFLIERYLGPLTSGASPGQPD